MSTDWMFAALLAVVFLCAIVCTVAWKVAYGDGWEARGLHERNLRSTGLLAGRAQQRESAFWGPVYGADAGPDDFDRWLQQLKKEDDGERLADTGEMRMLKDYHPAGGRHAADGPADTGSFRADLVARTDAFIAQITGKGS